MYGLTRRCLDTAVRAGLNRVALCGAVHGAHTGLYRDTPTVEFTLTTQSLMLSDSSTGPLSSSSSSSPVIGSALPPAQKEQFTVRCVGTAAFAEALASVVEENSVVQLTGRVHSRQFTETPVGGTAGGKKVSHLHTLVLVRQADLQRTRHELHFLHLPSSASTQLANSYLREAIFAPSSETPQSSDDGPSHSGSASERETREE